MYITISKKISKEDIAKYQMKVSENDSITDYRIDLTSLNEETKKALCVSYNILPERLENHTTVTFSFIHEI